MVARNLLVALVFGFGLVATVGCQQGVARDDFDKLKVHNEKLMNENAQLRSEWEEQQANLSRTAAAPVEPIPAVRPTQNDFDRIKPNLPANTTLVDRNGKAVIRIDGGMVNYGAGKAMLTPEGKQAMDKVALILNRDFPTRTIVVEGHTDTQPIVRTANLYKNNWELGMKRSTEVVDYLTMKGVDPKRIRATSLGEHQPISDNGTPNGRAKNRRVEIVVMPEDAFSSTAPTSTASAPY